MMPLDHLEENSDEEAGERGIPVKRSIEHAFVVLAVVAIVIGAAGQWEALGDGKMYGTDLGIDKIQRVNLDGTGMEDLVTSGLIAPRGIALDVAGGKMYWMDAGSSKIQRATLDGTSVEDLITTYSSGPMGGGGKRYGIALATAR
jgi:Low-density lipoprotein receptor repeat class B